MERECRDTSEIERKIDELTVIMVGQMISIGRFRARRPWY